MLPKERYEVRLVCKNPDCDKKVFSLPDWLSPTYSFICYGYAAKFASAIKGKSIQELLTSADADTDLANNIGTFIANSLLDRVISCPTCKAALPAHQFDTIIVEAARSDDTQQPT